MRALLAMVLVASLALAGCTQWVRDASGSPTIEWALSLSGIDALHEQGLTGAGVTIAVVDTGIDAGHAEFAGVSIQWLDLVNRRPDAYDDRGHGTHVAGLVAGQGKGGAFGPSVRGAAPGARLLVVKAINSGGQGDGQVVAQAVDAAVNNGAHVLVLSLGGKPGLLPLGNDVEDAVQRAIDRGVVVVAAAGNADEGQSGRDCTVRSPGSVPGVIAVGAVDGERTIATFSCTGDNAGPIGLGLAGATDPDKKPEVVAAGVELVGPWPGLACGKEGPASQYCVASGTSQAVPLVGGAIALLLEARPALKRSGPSAIEEIKEALMRTSEKVGPLAGGGPAAHHDRYGYGVLRADLALQRL